LLNNLRPYLPTAILLALCLVVLRSLANATADDAQSTTFIIGHILDGQGAPVDGALVPPRAGQGGRVLAESESQGDFREELLQLIREMHMDILVIGRPRRGPGQSAFTDSECDAFLAELQALGVTIDNRTRP